MFLSYKLMVWGILHQQRCPTISAVGPGICTCRDRREGKWEW